LVEILREIEFFQNPRIHFFSVAREEMMRGFNLGIVYQPVVVVLIIIFELNESEHLDSPLDVVF